MIRKEVRDFEPYTVMEGDYSIWLDKNESPFDIPMELKESLFSEIKLMEFNRYPDIAGGGLKKKLADKLGFAQENIVVGNGSDQLIDCILDLFTGDHIVIHTPTFGMYSFYAKKRGLNIIKVSLNKKFQLPDINYDLEGARAIFLCSPNTPMGSLLRRENIVKYLETGYPIILDEAYIDFADTSNLDLVEDYPNLIVLRTFSKAYGLAALRVGYAVGHESVMEQMSKIISPYNVNRISLEIAERMSDEDELIEGRIQYIIKERERIISELSEYAYPSQTNFVLLDLDAYEYLLERGIVVRKLGGRLAGKIRVTVGTREENTAVINALKEYISVLH
ncbi:MAG: histidinol-phosphate transaminase [Thermoplasmata archaeon]